MNKFFHPYHMVMVSPWPLLMSFSLMISMLGFLKLFNLNKLNLFIYGIFLSLIILMQWWRDIIREGIYYGSHSLYSLNGMKYGMILFILSEVMFFVSFFWTYFHMFLSPSIEIGLNWEPKMILVFNPLSVPLLNTMILLTSGIFITWSHMSLVKGMKNISLFSLLLTIILGLFFSFMQMQEYNESFYCINDSVYGSIFFLLTGFHGLHVIIGTIFMIVLFYRMLNSEMMFNRHVGYEFCAWYWHFVDLVWLMLYIFLYCLLVI